MPDASGIAYRETGAGPLSLVFRHLVFMIKLPDTVDVVIVGGGISGLAAAHWLNKQGVDVLVLEKDPEPGGTMRTVTERGFLVELGPNSALETTPLIQTLLAEVGMLEEFLVANPAGRNRFIVKHGTLHALPMSPVSFLGTPLFSLGAKLRLLREPFVGRAGREESIAEFVRRRLGDEFLEYAVDPFVAGIYAARPESLSVQAAFPKLCALEEKYGGLLRGMILGRKERNLRAEKAKDRARTFSFRDGMQSLPRAIARRLGDRARFSAKATLLKDRVRNGRGEESNRPRYQVEFLHRDAIREVSAHVVILATPSNAAAALIRTWSDSLAHTLGTIIYSPVASVFLGYRREDVAHPLNGFGFLVPSREQRRILGCLWSSSLFPRRAPEGQVGLTVFIGGGRQPELAGLDEEILRDLAESELKNIVQSRGKPVYWKVTKWPRAIPQYEVGYLDRMRKVTEFEEAYPGILFCSNYRGGIAVGDCIRNAEDIARRAAEHLKRLPHR